MAAWVIVTLCAALFSVTLFTQGVYGHMFMLREHTKTRWLLGRLRPMSKFMVLLFLLTLMLIAIAFPLYGLASFSAGYAFWLLFLLLLLLQSANVLSEWFPGYIYIQGVLGWVTPFLFGCFLASCFNGVHYYYETRLDAIYLRQFYWTNDSCGLDVLLNPWNMAFGFFYTFFTGHVGFLYLLRSVSSGSQFHRGWRTLFRLELLACLVFLVVWIYRIVMVKGYGLDADTEMIQLIPHKLYHVMEANRWILIIQLLGILGILTGMGQSFRRLFCNTAFQWSVGGGFILMIGTMLLLCNETLSFYPSSYQPSLSLTMAGSAASSTVLLWFVPFGGLVLLLTMLFVWILFHRLLGKS
jgi:cytochrome d ubiquinol oxidase subunit II